MIIASRKAAKSEYSYIKCCGLTQFAVEIDNPKLICKYVDKLRSIFLPARLGFDGDKNIIRYKDPFDPIHLPSTKSAEDACNLLFKKFDYSSRHIAEIGYNDRHIVMCTSHGFADGMTLWNLIHNLQLPSSNPHPLPLFPEPPEHTFKKEIASFDRTYPAYDKERLSKIHPKIKRTKLNSESWRPSISFHEDLKSFACFDHKMNKPHHMIDYIWNGITLSLCAYENSLHPYGFSTPVNIRSFISHPDNTIHLNHFGLIQPNCPISRDITIGQLFKLIRSDFNNKHVRRDEFAFYCNMFSTNNSYSVSDVSCLPPIHVKKPFIDAWMNIRMKEQDSEMFSVLSQSTINDDTDQQRYGLLVRYSSGQFDEKEVKSIIGSTLHFIKTMGLNKTVGEAFDEIKAFQNEYLKKMNKSNN